MKKKPLTSERPESEKEEKGKNRTSKVGKIRSKKDKKRAFHQSNHSQQTGKLKKSGGFHKKDRKGIAVLLHSKWKKKKHGF